MDYVCVSNVLSLRLGRNMEVSIMFKKFFSKKLSSNYHHQNNALDKIDITSNDIKLEVQSNGHRYRNILVPSISFTIALAIVLPITIINVNKPIDNTNTVTPNTDGIVMRLNEPVKDVNSDYTLSNSYLSAINHFSADMMNLLKKEKNDLVFSPLSIATCMSMLYEGSASKMKEELADILYIDESIYSHLEEIKHMLLSTHITKSIEGNAAYLDINQAIFPDMGFKDMLKQEYISTLTDYYFADVIAGRYSEGKMGKIVADYINDKTNNFLDVQPFDFTADTLIVLLNTLYMKANWYKDEVHKLLIDHTFTNLDGSEVDYDQYLAYSVMPGSTSYVYENECYEYVSIPLSFGFKYNILLPKDNHLDILDNPNTYLSLLDSTIRENETTKEQYDLHVYFPSFKEHSFYSLLDKFNTLGLHSFDLSNMVNSNVDIVIDSIIHEAGIEINEYGIEGAAYTMITVSTTSAPVRYPVTRIVDVNHPFLYSITYKDLPLFVGIKSSL